MTIAKLIWEKLRLVNRLPGAYSLYKRCVNFIYPDGKIVLLKRGPAAGYRWRHYHCHQAWMALGLYEPHVAQLIYDLLQPKDVFYDVGANAGYFTLVAAKAVVGGKVISFEPVPFNVRVIKEQINLNDLADRCIVEPMAISSTEGLLPFIMTERNANAHLRDVKAPNVLSDTGELIWVKTVTLDQYVIDHPRPTVIKMDIEGAEVEALKGARELLHSRDAPILLISTHSSSLESSVKTILREADYEIVNLEGFNQMVYAWKK